MKPIEQIDKEVRAKIIEEVTELLSNNDMRRHTTAQIKNGSYKIIGRPITLADVLSVMQFYAIDSKGFWLKAYGSEALGLHYKHHILTELRWNLSKSYEDQSEETKRFIHSVICK